MFRTQSRASRGAFDLLAIRGGASLGIQVKREALPVRFKPRAWSRMEADAARLRWRWVLAVVEPGGGRVAFLDPARATRGREIRVTARAVIENLLAWL